MSPLRQLAARLLISFVGVGVAVGAQAQAADSAVSFKPLIIAVSSPPRTLDPATATDAAGARLLQLTHPALLQWNARYEPVGLVAESCVQPNLTQASCTIRGRTFVDGTPVTAPVVASWFTQLQSNTLSPFGQLKGVKIAAADSATLTFRLASPTLGFLGTLTEIPIANPFHTIAGVGPYQIVARDALGAVTVATSRTDLAPALTFTPIADATTRLLKLKKGEIDAVYNDVAPQLVDWAKGQGFPVVAVAGTSYSYLALNMSGGVLGNATVRQALTLATNREGIRKYLLGDLAMPATTLLPMGHPAVWEAKEEAFDTFSAESLLDAAGYMRGPNNTRFTLTLLTSTDPFSQRVSQALQAQWAEVGVNVVLRPMEWASFYDAVKKGSFDMAMLAWAGEQRPDFYYHAFHSSQVPPNGLNRGRLKDAAVDAAVGRIMAAETGAQAAAATVEAQKVLAEVRPYIPLYRRHQVLITRPEVTGCQVTANGFYTGLVYCRKP